MFESVKKIDALRHAGYSFTIQAWSKGFEVEVAPPRKSGILSEYGRASSSTLAKALAAALRDAGEGAG